MRCLRCVFDGEAGAGLVISVVVVVWVVVGVRDCRC